MATHCFTPVRGRRMRLTRVDGCGRPIDSECSQVVTKGFVSATLGVETEDGDETTVKNASGELCVSDKACDSIKWFTTQVEFCQIDPDAIAIMNPTWKPELNADGDTVGFRISQDLDCDAGFALEIWTDVIGANSCDDPDAEGAWVYILIPWVIGGTPEDIEITSENLSLTLNGRTKINSKWGVGPYDIVRGTGGPGPLLSPVGPDEPILIQETTVAPPDPMCGCQPLNGGGEDTFTVDVVPDASDPLTFTATTANAPGASADFDWGDGNSDTGITVTGGVATATHTYAGAGSYPVNVTSGGETATGQAAPSEPFTLTATVDATDTKLVTATTARAPGASVDFDWGDGSADTEGVTVTDGIATATHTYATAGTFPITATATTNGQTATTEVTTT